MEKDTQITAQSSLDYDMNEKKKKQNTWYLGSVPTVASVIWPNTKISFLRWDATVTNLRNVALA